LNGEKDVAEFPGVFTMIIKQIVIPRSASKATFLCCSLGVSIAVDIYIRIEVEMAITV
jgi:hypothetical protein